MTLFIKGENSAFTSFLVTMIKIINKLYQDRLVKIKTLPVSSPILGVELSQPPLPEIKDAEAAFGISTCLKRFIIFSASFPNNTGCYAPCVFNTVCW